MRRKRIEKRYKDITCHDACKAPDHSGDYTCSNLFIKGDAIKMTAQDLKQIHAIKQEIKMWEEKLVELETKALAHGQVLTGMPGGNKTSDNVAFIASDIAEIKTIIEGKLTELKRVERETMDFIKKNGRLVVAYCLVLSFLCLFFDCGAYVFNGHVDNPTTGFEMIFGKQVDGYDLLNFNIAGLIILVVLCATAIYSVVLHFVKKINKVAYPILSGILIFLAVGYFCLPMSVRHAVPYVVGNFEAQMFHYAGVACIGAGFVISIVIMFFELFFDDEEDKHENKDDKKRC